MRPASGDNLSPSRPGRKAVGALARGAERGAEPTRGHRVLPTPACQVFGRKRRYLSGSHAGPCLPAPTQPSGRFSRRGGSIEDVRLMGAPLRPATRRTNSDSDFLGDAADGRALAESVARLHSRKGLQVDSELPIRCCRSRGGPAVDGSPRSRRAMGVSRCPCRPAPSATVRPLFETGGSIERCQMSIKSSRVHDWPPVTGAHASLGKADATRSLAVRPVASIQ